MDPAAIGIFDSGLGGLSVLRAVQRAAPGAELLYVADHAHAPYGEQSPQAIKARALALARWLVTQRVQALVVACNTATALAVQALRQELALPVVGIEPAVKPAAERTRSGVIGVLATSAMVASERMARLCDDHARPRGVRVLLQSGTGLVERIEAGDLDGPLTRALVERHVAPLRAAGIDVLVLGCTHYPLIAPTLQEALGAGVQLLDPAEAVARELLRRLGPAGESVIATPAQPAPIRLLTTGDPPAVQQVVNRLWTAEPEVQALKGV